MIDAELDREKNDLWFGAPPLAPVEAEDEPGRYAVRIIHPDGLVRVVSVWSTVRRAEKAAERSCDNLAAAGYDASYALVDVVDIEEHPIDLEEE